jgi:hypothetical protein
VAGSSVVAVADELDAEIETHAVDGADDRMMLHQRDQPAFR